MIYRTIMDYTGEGKVVVGTDVFYKGELVGKVVSTRTIEKQEVEIETNKSLPFLVPPGFSMSIKAKE